MSKYRDQRIARKILREGFVLPEQVEQFFINAKKSAVESMMAARKACMKAYADLNKNGKERYAKLPDEEKMTYKERYVPGTGRARVQVIMDYQDWYNKESMKITKRFPLRQIYDDAKAIKFVEDDCDMKRITFIIKVHSIVGDKVAGSNLYIDHKSGDVNGTIWGENGRTANVKTIGAGGYNIQCYHFRCLVRELVRHK